MTVETVTDQAITTTSDERTWALIAHLSVLINLFTGFLGPVVALIIYYSYKEKCFFF